DDAALPLTELALRWLRSKPVTGPILLGGSKTSHLQANIDALSRGPLSDDLVGACDEVGAALRGPMPSYNRSERVHMSTADAAARLRNRQPVLGYWPVIDSPVSTEWLAHIGWDYLALAPPHRTHGPTRQLAVTHDHHSAL